MKRAAENGVKKLYHHQELSKPEHWEWLSDTLATNRVRFSDVKKLNDPWDCRPQYSCGWPSIKKIQSRSLPEVISWRGTEPKNTKLVSAEPSDSKDSVNLRRRSSVFACALRIVAKLRPSRDSSSTQSPPNLKAVRNRTTPWPSAPRYARQRSRASRTPLHPIRSSPRPPIRRPASAR